MSEKSYNKKFNLFIIFTIIVLGGTISYFYYNQNKNLEKIEKKVHVGFQGLARHNTFLALQRLFESSNEIVESKNRFDGTYLSSYHESMLFAPINSLPTDEAGVAELTQWIKEGGILITGLLPEDIIHLDSLPANLKHTLAIEKITFQDGYDSDEDTSDSDDDSIMDLFSQTQRIRIASQYDIRSEQLPFVQKAYYEYRNKPLQVHMDVRKKAVCRHRNLQTIYSGDDELFNITQTGRGWVYLFNDFSIFTNEHIAKAHHATLSSSIVERHIPSVIDIIYQKNYSSLFSWLWHYASLAIICLIISIIAYIFCVTKRFGPKEAPDNIGERRSILEHIVASGKLSKKYQNLKWLLNQVQAEIHDIMRLRLNQWSKLDQTQQVKQLHKIIDLPEKEIQLAMNPTLNDMSQFTIIIHTLQKIRKQL